jgi:hypothetical protein
MALLNDALGVVQRKSLRRLFVSEDISSGIARRLSVRIFSSHFYRRRSRERPAFSLQDVNF